MAIVISRLHGDNILENIKPMLVYNLYSLIFFTLSALESEEQVHRHYQKVEEEIIKPSSLCEWKNRGEEMETVETSDLTPMYVLIASSSHHKIRIVGHSEGLS